MADMLASLLDMVDRINIGAIAGVLGTSEHATLQGLKLSIPVVLEGLALKAQAPGGLHDIMDGSPSTTQEITPDKLTDGLEKDSPLISEGERLLEQIFGHSESHVTATVAASTHLLTSTASTLLALTAPLVMSFLGKRMRSEGLNTATLGSELQRENSVIQSALPPGLREAYFADASARLATLPAETQPAPRRSPLAWLPVAAALLMLMAFWYRSHARRPSTGEEAASRTVGSASRLIPSTPEAACTMPKNLTLPEGGVESRFFAFVQNPDTKPDGTAWFVLDRVAFDPGSASLRRESLVQIENIAAILTSCSGVHVRIAGSGEGLEERALAMARARRVVDELVKKGVPRYRLAAEISGPHYRPGDHINGWGQNGSIAMLVTQK